MLEGVYYKTRPDGIISITGIKPKKEIKVKKTWLKTLLEWLFVLGVVIIGSIDNINL